MVELPCMYVENRLDRKPEGFLISLLRFARTSLFPTVCGLKLRILDWGLNSSIILGTAIAQKQNRRLGNATKI